MSPSIRRMYSFTCSIQIKENENPILLKLNFDFYSLFRVSIVGGVFLSALPIIGLAINQTEIVSGLLKVIALFLGSSSWLFFASKHYETNKVIKFVKKTAQTRLIGNTINN
jgi:hypothetical protein